MAKALVGYMNTTDPRAVASLVSENGRLRQRVADLEAHVLRLQAENDALAATVSTDDLLTVPDQMQPA
jgi:cell division protein FtsB